MISAVEQLRRIAPKDHDVVVKVANVTVIKTYFIEPHAFLFDGVNDVGEDTWIGLHFSQLIFAVIHRPKFRAEPVIITFSPHIVTGLRIGLCVLGFDKSTPVAMSDLCETLAQTPFDEAGIYIQGRHLLRLLPNEEIEPFSGQTGRDA